ncbi:MAG: hypothetical protein H0X37_06715 [Herpetosiphonaceae bacterium]|nr:hypothetical protein [Herpetosiphonaceae bacterium]
MPIYVFHLDAGGCGGCGAELQATVAAAPELALTQTPAEAQVVALTGAAMPAIQGALRRTLKTYCAHLPLVVVGRCALHGTPFGQGGIGQWAGEDQEQQIMVNGRVDGCPPVPKVIVDVLLRAVQERP